MSLLQLSRISAFYGASQALFDMNLSLEEGQVLALMGRNGMGKSTTVKVICRLLRARDGEARFAGQDIGGLPPHRVAQLGIGLVPEGRRCFATLTVAENLLAAARPGAWDFAAVAATILLTLTFGVEVGVSSGVVLSIVLFLYKTSRPHIAEVGLVPGTEHFRNIDRHHVLTHPELLSLRLDENLYFANARYIEDYILDRLAKGQPVKHVVLMCSAVNVIDLSALESLEELNRRMDDMGIRLHLSEVKGPVMDRLQKTHFLDDLTGQVFLSQYGAMKALGPVDGLKPKLAAE